jgi:hypothetical protein
MPTWWKIAAGLVVAAGLALSVALIDFGGFRAYSEKLGPLVQEHGTTYYNDDGPVAPPVTCKPESEILGAIDQVNAKYDYLAGAELKAFEQRATLLKGLPPLNVDELYVITEDDKLQTREMVLFIGLRSSCVTTVFGLSAKLYRELLGKSEAS